MNLKKKIAEKEEARLEKQVKEMNAKSAEKPAQEKKRGRKKKTATNEESSAVVSNLETVQDQSAKADCGKPKLSLVPMKIMEAIARVREYGNRKYKSSDNWKTVEIERYRDATLRHLVQYIDDPKSVDEESGLPHLWHVACNVAFLVSLEK